jgi:hypothetical protein
MIDSMGKLCYPAVRMLQILKAELTVYRQFFPS